MKKFNVFFLSLVVATFVVFNSCGDDKGGGTSNFGSQSEADAAVQQNSAYIISTVTTAVATANLATTFDGGFGFGGFGKASPGTLPTAMGGGYNSGTGWWTFDTTYADTTGDFSLSYQLRFTPRGVDGLPTEATNQMEYGFDVSLDYDEETGSLVLDYNGDMDVTGVSGYNAGTGNATINGSWNNGISIVTSSGQTYTFEYVYAIDYNALVVSPTATYRIQSGSIEFVLRYDITPNIQGFEEYNVAGTITFDGTRYADLEIGGYHYIIDLQTNTISPV